MAGKLCAPCAERTAALCSGTMYYDGALGGYVLTGAPRRAMSSHVRYVVYAERGDVHHPDHGGEPFVWTHDCPFCGGKFDTGEHGRPESAPTSAEGGE